MIFVELFFTFLIIGAFTFGGGYSMVALIQDEVVLKHGWMTGQEFADLLAVSQMTPGPIGINTATYAGYTAVANSGLPTIAAVGGALLASVAVILIPVALLLLLSGWLKRHSNDRRVAQVLKVVRLSVVGLIAAAALGLMNSECFGFVGLNRHFVTSAIIFCAVFWMEYRYKTNPLLLFAGAGLAGLVVYGF